MPEPAGSPVRFERDGAVGVITLNRPPGNVIDLDVIDALLAALDDLEGSPGVRALLLRAEGDVFSEGFDPIALRGRGAAELNEAVLALLEVGSRIDGLPFPTLAAARGSCVSVALEICLSCDFLWLGSGTRLGLPAVRDGIVPLAGGMHRLALVAGSGVARRVALGGRLHDAAEFAGWGIADRVMDPGVLDAEARAHVRELAQGPTRAYALIKAVLQRHADSLGASDDALLRGAADVLRGADAEAGMAAAAAVPRATPRFNGHS